MKWRTHIRIAHEVLYRLRISKGSAEAKSLREGIITPDKWKDFPHHHGKGKDIEEHIIEARKLFLEDNLEAYFHLGVALHYIQDSYTSLTSRSEHHSRWEEQMDQAYFNDNLPQLVRKAFHEHTDQFKEYQSLANLLSHEIDGKEATLRIATMPGPGFRFWGREWGKPYVDVNFALRASYLVTKAVSGRKDNLKLQQDLDRTHLAYEKKLQESEISFATKITKLVKKRDELEKRKVEDGFLQTIKNSYFTLLSKIQGFRATRNLGKYDKQKHLNEVLREYDKETRILTAPHYLWYIFNIPEVRLSIVKKELLSFSDVMEHLQFEEKDVREFVDQEKISCYRLKDSELFTRSEIEQITQQ